MSSTIDPTLDPTAAPDTGDAGGEEELNCGTGGGADTFFGLRIASIFVILVTSTFGALFPVLARRSRLRNVIPHSAFELVPLFVFSGLYESSLISQSRFAKYFGSGVIIATAFIHLLDPAIEALGNPCLTGAWTEYVCLSYPTIDVETCESTHLPDETTVIGSGGCFVSVTVIDANTKKDVNATVQTVVLNRLQRNLDFSCFNSV